ncbi:MAG: OmpA family protein [Rhodospirillales bacterium]|nr:OmpA family protein [Rhodospirillales bacterium]
MKVSQAFLSLMVVTSLSLTSCATPPLVKRPIEKVESSAFLKALHTEYATLAAHRRSALDFKDSKHFKAKAAAAAEGTFMAPDSPDIRHLATDNYPGIWAAYERLQALPARVFSAYPKDSAKAHVMYDCWLEQLEEQKQNYKSTRCEQDWNNTILNLECAEHCSGDPSAAYGIPVNDYNVLFALNSIGLDDKALKTIDAIVNVYKNNHISIINITGYTDRSGSYQYNKTLALKRAEAVASTLIEKNIPQRVVVVNAMGEQSGAIHTDDDVKMESNRRVNVQLFR